MNLMFRKNFHEGRTSGGHGGLKLGNKPNRSQQAKRSRDMAYQYAEEVHYRTHIFFAPNRSGNQIEQEGCIDVSVCYSYLFSAFIIHRVKTVKLAIKTRRTLTN